MGGGWIFFFGGGEGHRGTQKGCTGYSTHTGVRMCTHRGTQMYKGVRGVHGGTHGCTGEHRGTQAYTWVHKGYTRVHKGYTRGTVRRAGVLYTGVQYCTQGYYTQGYTGVHRGTQGYTGVYIHRGAGSAQAETLVFFIYKFLEPLVTVLESEKRNVCPTIEDLRRYTFL